MTINAVKAGGKMGTVGLDDDKNGESVDGRNMCDDVEQNKNSTERRDNKGLDVNDGEKDVEEEGLNEEKLGHECNGVLPGMN